MTDTDTAIGEMRLAVLGKPIAHSKSPVIQLAAYGLLGIGWRYDAIECDEAGLAGLLDSRGPEWRGFSLTMPLKEEAFRLAQFVDPVAVESGVVNTLLRLSDDGSGLPHWAGYNTDVAGIASAIARAGLDATDVVVIGSGATAVSSIMAVRRLGGARVTLLARNEEAMVDLVARFDDTREPDLTGSASGPTIAVASVTMADAADPVVAQRLAEATLVISTLPGQAGAGLGLPAGLETVPLFDVAYDPWPSPLAVRWSGAGGTAHAGLEMLIEQAIVQIRIFLTGDPRVEVPHEGEVREAMIAASAAASGSASSSAASGSASNPTSNVGG